jgi:hypothetical protein
MTLIFQFCDWIGWTVRENYIFFESHLINISISDQKKNEQILRTSLLCKVEFTLLQSIFSRQNFLLYFGKGKFGGKKFTLQKSEFYFAKEFFPNFNDFYIYFN